MPTIRIVLSCDGVPAAEGAAAAQDIAAEFAEHRSWVCDVTCTWDGARLVLSASSDDDPDGRALLDEFSDCLSAYIASPFDGQVRVESIT